jgi:hypothetical protein
MCIGAIAEKIYGPTLFGATLVLAMSQPAAATTALVNFDPPTIAQGPSTYVAAGPQQTITTTPAVFTGGVVLGFATFFPAISFATAPNVYGTADFGNGLANTLNIGINPGFTTTEVSFALFNGETFNQSYVATAYNGGTAVGSQTLSNVAANFNSGYGVIDLKASNITSVVIAPKGAPSVWDFLIDTVAFNQTVQQGVTNSPPPVTPPPPVFVPPPPVLVNDNGNEVELELNYGDTLDGRGTINSLNNLPVTPGVPEPSTWAMLLIGFAGLGCARYAQEHKRATRAVA